MKFSTRLGGLLAATTFVCLLAGADQPASDENKPTVDEAVAKVAIPEARPIAPFVEKSLAWLVKAQHTSGGWGGGSHAQQQIRDPHAVKPDPATTSFAALALLRSGHTPTSGSYQEAVFKATEFLVAIVEEAPEEGPKITTLTGTQPQAKLGQLVDTTMTTQYLARVKTALDKNHKLYARVDRALSKCVKKLEDCQAEDGSWNVGGGWAPVLQSSSGQTALELAQVAGEDISRDKLKKAREYQKKNFKTDTGKVDASKGAGVALYAFSGAQRANAPEARAAQDILNEAKRDGRLDKDAQVSEKTLEKAGVAAPMATVLADAARQNRKQIEGLKNEQLLRGFGNNGGEEFVSFLLTSESMIIAGGDQWAQWNDKMHGLLKKVQNPDGSWSGHHCITSSVFCTAAAVQCLTTDRDAELLVQVARRAAKNVKIDEIASSDVSSGSG